MGRKGSVGSAGSRGSGARGGPAGENAHHHLHAHSGILPVSRVQGRARRSGSLEVSSRANRLSMGSERSDVQVARASSGGAGGGGKQGAGGGGAAPNPTNVAGGAGAAADSGGASPPLGSADGPRSRQRRASDFSTRWDHLNKRVEPLTQVEDLRSLVLKGKMKEEVFSDLYRLASGSVSSEQSGPGSPPSPEDGAASPARSSLRPSSPVAMMGAFVTSGKTPPPPPTQAKKKKAMAPHLRPQPRISYQATSSERLGTWAPSATAQDVFNEKPIMQGYLFKRATRSGRNWRKRYFLLYASRLEYRTTKESKYAKGEMWLSEHFYVADSQLVNLNNGKDRGFMLSDFATTYYFAAESVELKLFWMHAVSKVLRVLQDNAKAKNEPVLLGRPVRTKEEISRDLSSRQAAYRSSLAGADALEIEEAIRSGEYESRSPRRADEKRGKGRSLGGGSGSGGGGRKSPAPAVSPVAPRSPRSGKPAPEKGVSLSAGLAALNLSSGSTPTAASSSGRTSPFASLPPPSPRRAAAEDVTPKSTTSSFFSAAPESEHADAATVSVPTNHSESADVKRELMQRLARSSLGSEADASKRERGAQRSASTSSRRSGASGRKLVAEARSIPAGQDIEEADEDLEVKEAEQDDVLMNVEIGKGVVDVDEEEEVKEDEGDDDDEVPREASESSDLFTNELEAARMAVDNAVAAQERARILSAEANVNVERLRVREEAALANVKKAEEDVAQAKAKEEEAEGVCTDRMGDVMEAEQTLVKFQQLVKERQAAAARHQQFLADQDADDDDSIADADEDDLLEIDAVSGATGKALLATGKTFERIRRSSKAANGIAIARSSLGSSEVSERERERERVVSFNSALSSSTVGGPPGSAQVAKLVSKKELKRLEAKEKKLRKQALKQAERERRKSQKEGKRSASRDKSASTPHNRDSAARSSKEVKAALAEAAELLDEDNERLSLEAAIQQARLAHVQAMRNVDRAFSARDKAEHRYEEAVKEAMELTEQCTAAQLEASSLHDGLREAQENLSFARAHEAELMLAMNMQRVRRIEQSGGAGSGRGTVPRGSALPLAGLFGRGKPSMSQQLAASPISTARKAYNPALGRVSSGQVLRPDSVDSAASRRSSRQMPGLSAFGKPKSQRTLVRELKQAEFEGELIT